MLLGAGWDSVLRGGVGQLKADGNIGLAAGGRRGHENEFFVHTNPSPMRKHLVLCEPSLL